MLLKVQLKNHWKCYHWGHFLNIQFDLLILSVKASTKVFITNASCNLIRSTDHKQKKIAQKSETSFGGKYWNWNKNQMKRIKVIIEVSLKIFRSFFKSLKIIFCVLPVHYLHYISLFDVRFFLKKNQIRLDSSKNSWWKSHHVTQYSNLHLLSAYITITCIESDVEYNVCNGQKRIHFLIYLHFYIIFLNLILSKILSYNNYYQNRIDFLTLRPLHVNIE